MKTTNKYRACLSRIPRALHPFIDRRAFQDKEAGRSQAACCYQPDERLTPAFFYSHHLLDGSQCSKGAMRRFDVAGTRRYLLEKFAEEPWVAEGNARLSELLEGYIRSHLGSMEKLDEIRILDFGPGGGAITTLFALRALDRYGLMEKARIFLLDVVPEVISMTIQGDFVFPQEAVDQHGLHFAGVGGSAYRRILSRATPVVADFHHYEPGQRFHIIVNGYAMHHLNIFDKEDCAVFMQRNLEQDGAIAVVDFFVETFEEYRGWLLEHMGRNPDSPAPVESPYFSREQIQGLFPGNLKMSSKDDDLPHSWAMVMMDDS